MILLIASFVFFACEKEKGAVSSNNSDINNKIESDVLSIFHSLTKGENNSLKNLDDLNIQNLNNPFDSVGYLHNEVLSFIIQEDIDESTLCEILPDINTHFGVDISNDCDQWYSLCEDGISNTFDDEGNYKSDMLLNLCNEDKISESEYQIINTTFLNVGELDINSIIEFIKDVEAYTLENTSLDTEGKNRVLRTFAIYRYSSYYWRVENQQPQGPISALADAIAMHWALTSDDSWAQDGKDVYAIAGTVSAYVHLWTGC